MKVATANCGILMGPTSVVSVSNQNVAHDLAMPDLFETMIRSSMIVLWLMNLFGAIGLRWLARSMKAP